MNRGQAPVGNTARLNCNQIAPASDAFGAGVTSGDCNGDGRHDLVVAVPGHDIVAADAGAVQVIYPSDFLFVDGFED